MSGQRKCYNGQNGEMRYEPEVNYQLIILFVVSYKCIYMIPSSRVEYANFHAGMPGVLCEVF